MTKIKDKLISEIVDVIGTKSWNVEYGTMTERERQIVAECQGFLSLLLYSSLTVKEIKELWEKSMLKYQ